MLQVSGTNSPLALTGGSFPLPPRPHTNRVFCLQRKNAQAIAEMPFRKLYITELYDE
jgi:hypothetical protein